MIRQPLLARSATSPAAATRAETVLIVEDDAGVVLLQRKQLERAGYRVLTAANANEAMARVQQGPVDLILLDYRLAHHHTGLEFHEQLKSAGYQVPVIMVTGFSDEATVIKALRSGVRDFVTKSVEYLDYLPEAAARVLMQVRTERQLAESEARLASLIGSAKDAIILATADRRIRLFNAAAEHMFRCTGAEAVGQPLTRFIPNEYQATAGANGDAQPSDESVTLLIRTGSRGVRADGEEFPLEASVSSATVEGQKFYTVIVRDVTERKNAERRQATQYAVTRALAEAATLADAAPKILQALCEGVGWEVGGLWELDREQNVLRCAGFWNDPGLGLAAFAALTREFTFAPGVGLPGRVWASGQPVFLGDLLRERNFPRAETAARCGLRGACAFPITSGEEFVGVVEFLSPRSRQPDDDLLEMMSALGNQVGQFIARRAAEEQLRLLGAAVEQETSSIVITTAELDPPGPRIVFVNAGFTRMTGYSAADVIGKTPRILQGPKTNRSLMAELRNLLARGRSFYGETVNYRKDGAEFLIGWHVSTIRDQAGRITHFVAVQRDITERKRSEEQLREQAALLDKAQDAIMVRDAEDRITFWNRGAERLYGWIAEEVMGRSAREVLNKAPVPELEEARRKVLLDGEWAGELRQVTKDGREITVESRWTLVRDEKGEPKAWLVINTDVTERKKLQEQLILAQRMEGIGVLAGGVAHDFNNLLTVIKGFSEMLLGGLCPEDPSHGLLREIHKAGERAAGLTRQLLAFSRKQVLQPQVLDLNLLVSESEKMLRRLIGEDVDMTAILDPLLGRVKADPGQIEQVIMNLVVNARDAMPTGGALTIETRNVERGPLRPADHSDDAPGPCVLLAVTDTGCGMDAATKAHIFEPFFTTKEAGKGTGLGLATVYGIVNQSGGLIQVDSEPGRGSTFKVYLPRLTEKESQSAQLRSGLPANPRGAETVLVAEDEEAIRGLVRLALQSHGYTVLEASDGEEALRIGLEHPGPVHLLLTDVVMPKMSGRQLADILTAARPEIKVLYVSGYTDDAVVRHGVLESGTPFLQKPFTPVVLTRKMREVLDGEHGSWRRPLRPSPPPGTDASLRG